MDGIASDGPVSPARDANARHARRLMRVASALGGLGILALGIIGGIAGCGPMGSSSISPQPALGTSPLPGRTEPMVTATSCAALPDAAQRMPAYQRSLVDGLGTQRDPRPVFAELSEDLGIMTALAPACEPMAVEEITALDAAARDAMARYDTDVVTAMDGSALAALDLMAQRGREAWAAMGMSPAAWP